MKLAIIEVRPDVEHRQGISRDTSRPYDFHIQTAYFHSGDEYPVRLDIMLEDGVVLTPGKYLPGAESFQFDRKANRWAMRPNRGLIPLAEAVALLADSKAQRPSASN